MPRPCRGRSVHGSARDCDRADEAAGGDLLATDPHVGDVLGDFGEGKQFDAICLRPPVGTALDIGLRHAGSPEEALGKVFALAGDADVADVWVGGEQIASGGFVRPVAVAR